MDEIMTSMPISEETTVEITVESTENGIQTPISEETTVEITVESTGNGLQVYFQGAYDADSSAVAPVIVSADPLESQIQAYNTINTVLPVLLVIMLYTAILRTFRRR